MPFYNSADQIYDCLQTVFNHVGAHNPNAGTALLSLHLVTRMRLTAPAAQITIDSRRRPIKTTYGPSPLRTDVEVEMAADTLHRILLGELLPKKAWANGLVKLRGPSWKTLVLADLFYQSQAIYRQVLREQGLM